MLADAIARHRRMFEPVFLQTGTDEHGLKVVRAAESRGVVPQQHVDKVSAEFRAMCDCMGIAYDSFIRTSDPLVHAAARMWWTRAKKDIYLGHYEGWYSVREECFVDEDQKDDPHVEWRSEETYFFRLENYRQAILDHITKNPSFIAPESARNEVLGLLREPLPDLSISRTNFSWGVPVPGDERHVMYVWVDALSNYLVHRWPADLHVIGKDIVKFHAIYWPAFLMAMKGPGDKGAKLPRRILVHGFFTHNGAKMSKSLGNVIDPITEIDRVGLDALRWYLLRVSRFAGDADYQDGGPLLFYRELSGVFGNLAQRTLSQIQKNCRGESPKVGISTARDTALADALSEHYSAYDRLMMEGRVNQAVEELIGIGQELNAYIQEQAPWSVRKTDPARADSILAHVLLGLRSLAKMLTPIIPDGAQRLIDQLYPIDGKFPEPTPAFPRIEDELLA